MDGDTSYRFSLWNKEGDAEQKKTMQTVMQHYITIKKENANLRKDIMIIQGQFNAFARAIKDHPHRNVTIVWHAFDATSDNAKAEELLTKTADILKAEMKELIKKEGKTIAQIYRKVMEASENVSLVVEASKDIRDNISGFSQKSKLEQAEKGGHVSARRQKSKLEQAEKGGHVSARPNPFTVPL